MHGDDTDGVKTRRSPGYPQNLGAWPYTALTVSVGIDDIGRFASAAKLEAYAGIVPVVRSSGKHTYMGSTTKRGGNMMRRVPVESIHTHRYYAPASDISAFYDRIFKGKRNHGRATVAAANKMLVAAYRMLREQRPFALNYGQDTSHGEH